MQLLRGRTSAVAALAFSPSGCLLAAAGAGGQGHVWDLADPAAEPRTYPGMADELAFLSDDALLARVSFYWTRHELAGGPGVELSPPPGHDLGAVDPPRALMACSLTPDAGEPGVVTFRITAGGLAAPAVRPLKWLTRPMLFAPDGVTYVCLTRGVQSRIGYHLREAATGEVVAELTAPDWGVHPHRWQFSPGGRRLFASAPGLLVAFDGAGGPALATREKVPGLRDFAAHPGGRLLATIEDHRAVTLRHADTLTVVRTYDFRMPKLTAVAFSPDGTLGAVGNSKGKVLLFDVDD